MIEKSEEFFRIHHIPPYVLGEIAQAVIESRLSGIDVIDLSHLNPNMPPPAVAVDKLVQASLQPHNHRYSSSQGITKLRAAACSWYEKHFSVSLDDNREIVVTMGTKEGLSHLLMAIVSAGDTIILPTPSYPIHSAAIVLSGAGVIGVNITDTRSANGESHFSGLLSEENDDFFDRLSVAYEHTWPRPILMVLSFPHNPTTTVVTKGFFQRLVNFARLKGMYIIHDFAYAGICFDDYIAPSILEVEGAKNVAVEFISLSKGLGIPGWRVGFCAGNEKLVAALKKIKSYFDCGVFQPLQIAAVKAIECWPEVLAESLSHYLNRRNVLVEGLTRNGWQVLLPKGSLFVWAKLPKAVSQLGSLKSARILLSEAHVATCPGFGFDPEMDQYVRFALVENEKRLRMAISRIEKLNWADA